MTRCLFFFLSFFVTLLCNSSGEKLIVNIDPGSDDAVALLLLLRFEKSQPSTSAFEIIGITCSYGNTNLENVEQNVLKTLTVAGRNDIPVYSGSHKGFITPFSTDNYFGSDGFGDFTFNQTITATIDRSKHAAVALVDMAREHAGNVSVLSVGPTTNIGLAIALDRKFTKNVQHFYVMGGNVHGAEFEKSDVEFNFGADPESTFVLFDSTAESQITLLPFNTVLKTNISEDWRINVLGKYDSPYMRFLNKAESANLGHTDIWVSADTIMAACVIEKSLITSYSLNNVDTVTDGKARGSVFVDLSTDSEKVKNSMIIESVNVTLYQETLIKYLTCEDNPCNTD